MICLSFISLSLKTSILGHVLMWLKSGGIKGGGSVKMAGLTTA